MNALHKRRLKTFCANKRGLYSLYVFSFFFVLSLFAEFIANDKPFLIHYKNSFYSPLLNTYYESDFGGEFESEADYKDIYVQELINKEGFMLWPLIPYSYNTIKLDASTPHPAPPNLQNLLGTDDQGRDVFARLLYGFRLSVLFGFTLTLLSSIIGIVAGAMQGYFGGLLDLFAQRFIEIWSSLPMLYLLMILANFVEPNFWWLLGLMLLFSWTALVGVVRAEFLRCRNFEYVLLAKAMGVKDSVIMFRHILPNALVATMTFMPFMLSGSITTLTSLDFLGFGMPVGTPSLGELLAQGKANLHAPWLGISAFLVLSVMLTLLVFIGEAIRDAFDARIES